jgi:hypothetical protein
MQELFVAAQSISGVDLIEIFRRCLPDLIDYYKDETPRQLQTDAAFHNIFVVHLQLVLGGKHLTLNCAIRCKINLRRYLSADSNLILQGTLIEWETTGHPTIDLSIRDAFWRAHCMQKKLWDAEGLPANGIKNRVRATRSCAYLDLQ